MKRFGITYLLVSALIAAAVGYLVTQAETRATPPSFAVRIAWLPSVSLPPPPYGGSFARLSLGTSKGALVVGSTLDDTTCGVQLLIALGAGFISVRS